MHMPDTEQADWRTPEQRARDIAEAKALRDPARKGGLRFEAYLPPELADWILEYVERGVFTDPSEAVFVMLGEQKDLEAHVGLRQECLRRSLMAARDNSGSGLSGEETKAWLEKLVSQPPAQPAVWKRRDAQS